MQHPVMLCTILSHGIFPKMSPEPRLGLRRWVSVDVSPQGGELILPHKGRTLMGYEKLLLQGIPFSRLLLGPETEVQ